MPALSERPHPAARGGALRQPEGGAAAAGEGRLAARHRQGEPAMGAARGPPAPPRPRVDLLLCDGIRNVHSDQAYGEWVQGEFISGLGAVPWCRCLAEGSPEGRP